MPTAPTDGSSDTSGPFDAPAPAPPALVRDSFPVVGIGASAGGLAAFEAFFAGMPAQLDPEMAFVVVQHLAPERSSLLVTLLQRCTRMPVVQITDGLALQPNVVHVIPPAHDLALVRGVLHLLPPSLQGGLRLPIDTFFRSLAEDQQDRAVGIVLSGTGHDGTLGLRAIRDRGGLVMVQTEASTAFAGMPRSAVAAGLADFELEPSQMPAQLIAYARHAIGPRRAAEGQGLAPADQAAMGHIHLLLRARTGHDFSRYKASTVARRIERRMAANQIGTLAQYAQFLQATPAEAGALLGELLIGVTRFFRDPDVFSALARELAVALKPPRGNDPVRVWSVGCSTGEEVYSLVMLLDELTSTWPDGATSPPVQVFATDIDRRAIATARAGVYPVGIAADVSAERLARYFTAEPDGRGWRVHKRIRERVVFSDQDVITDPPFSRLDLLVCRNVLIYLDAALQQRLIPLFHYALKPGGLLLLGTAEGTGPFDELFTPLDRAAKLFRRVEVQADPRRLSQPRFNLQAAGAPPALPVGLPLAPTPRSGGWRELAERAVLAQLDPVAALVTAAGDILYLLGRSGPFLEPAPGEPGTPNILRMAREGLGPSLGLLLHQATRSQQPAAADGLRVRSNGHFSSVRVVVRPVPGLIGGAGIGGGQDHAADPTVYLVMLSVSAAASSPGADDLHAAHAAAVATTAPAAAPDGSPAVDAAPGPDDPGPWSPALAAVQIAALQSELRAKDDYLLSTHEQLQRANEELTSINEEAQSINEELQSTNEELETSKEELQSVNEELTTTNTELENKLADLTRANNDMNNLLAGTGIGTVFVDHQLRILRFTPAAAAIINLIPGDAGRPVAHIASNLVGYHDLLPDTQAVLDTLLPKEREVQTTDGRWYALRIQPYRTLDNVIEGAVISFIDISAAVRVRQELQQVSAQLRLAAVARDNSDAVVVQALDGRILAWNPAAERLYGWAEAQALQMSHRQRVPLPAQAAEALQWARLADGTELAAYTAQRLHREGRVMAVWSVASRLLDDSGAAYAISTIERPLPEEPP